MSKLAQPEDVADLVMFVVTQSSKVYTTTNPEIEMRAHWDT